MLLGMAARRPLTAEPCKVLDMQRPTHLDAAPAGALAKMSPADRQALTDKVLAPSASAMAQRAP